MLHLNMVYLTCRKPKYTTISLFFLNKEFCKSDTNFWVEVAPTKCRNVIFLHYVSAQKCVPRGQVDLNSVLILKHLKHQNFLDIPRVQFLKDMTTYLPPPKKKTQSKIEGTKSLYVYSLLLKESENAEALVITSVSCMIDLLLKDPFFQNKLRHF